MMYVGYEPYPIQSNHSARARGLFSSYDIGEYREHIAYLSPSFPMTVPSANNSILGTIFTAFPFSSISFK